MVGEGQPGCRTNAVDCSRCLSGSGRVAVGGGIGGGGGGGGEKLQQQEPVCWRPAARRCRSRATSGWSRMLNPAQRFHTADTSEESWVRLGRGGDRGQIRSEQHFWWMLDWHACNVSPLLTDVSFGSLYHFFYIMQGGIAFHKSGKARSAK